MSYALWLDMEGPSPHFEHFAELSADRGLPIVGFGSLLTEPLDGWFTRARALVINSGIYLDQVEVRAAFLEALRRGTRLLVLRASVGVSGIGGSSEIRHGDTNSWLTDLFEIGIVDDVHRDTSRWEDDSWEHEERDILVARPADAVARLNPLVAGVSEVLMDMPRVVRCFAPTARPLLNVRIADVITRSDLRWDPAHTTREDACVAAAAGPSGPARPQTVVLGDGGCLSDRLISASNNRRFAENVANWLAGQASEMDLATEATELVDEIDLTLSEVVVGVLGQVREPEPWWAGLSEERLNAVRTTGVPIERALNILDKIKLARSEPSLDVSVVRVGGRSKREAKSFWAAINDVRNRVKHRERLLDDPVTAADIARLREAVAALRARHFAYMGSLEADPRRLNG